MLLSYSEALMLFCFKDKNQNKLKLAVFYGGNRIICSHISETMFVVY